MIAGDGDAKGEGQRAMGKVVRGGVGVVDEAGAFRVWVGEVGGEEG